MLEAEEARLSPLACRSRLATRRRPIEPPAGPPEADFRTEFQRDRDRILHSHSFRRLKHKTQVFIPFEGDHFRTRLTHTLEVDQIARTAARALGLNEDLVEACALGHDLGHTPFGHSGERVLDSILTGRDEVVRLPKRAVAGSGGFKHNYQSIRIVDLLERRYQAPGLDLTDQTREGMLKHTSWKRDTDFPLPERAGLRLDRSCHLEGQLVGWADEIAQQAHDLEDGLVGVDLTRLGELAIVRPVDGIGWSVAAHLSTEERTYLIRSIISTLVTDLVVASNERIERWIQRNRIDSCAAAEKRRDRLPGGLIGLSDEGRRLFLELKEFVYLHIIQGFPIARRDGRARTVVRGLTSAYLDNPRLAPDYLLRRFAEENGAPFLREVSLAKVEAEIRRRYRNRPELVRLVADHIAGMTDSYALEEYRALTGAYPTGER